MRKGNPNNKELMPEDIPYVEPQTAEDYLEFTKGLLGDNVEGQPKETATQSNPATSKDLSYTEQVNKLIKEVTVDEAGKFVYPDNTPEHLKYAVAAEKKYRDTQTGFTKSQMSLKEAEVETKALREQLVTNSTTALELSEADAARLDDLKFTDPDGWRREMNKLESEHNKSVHQKIEDSMSEVRGKAGAEFELERRVNVLKELNAGRDAKSQITVEMLDNDIPPRISSKLADGHLTFEGYLSEVSEYLGKGKVVLNEEGGSGTKLTKGAGSTTPPAEDTKLEEGALDYSQMTF